MLFKITYSSTFNVSVQALSLIAQVAKKQNVRSQDGFVVFGSDDLVAYHGSILQSVICLPLRPSVGNLFEAGNIFESCIQQYKSRRRQCPRCSIHQTHHSDAPASPAIVYMRLLVSFRTGLRAPFPQVIPSLTPAQIFTAQPRLRTLVSEAEDDSLETMQEIGDTAHADHVVARPYDGRKRDPQFSHADKTCLWELVSFLFFTITSLSPDSDSCLCNIISIQASVFMLNSCCNSRR